MDFLEQSKAEARQLTLFGMIWRAVRSGVYLWWLTRKKSDREASGERRLLQVRQDGSQDRRPDGGQGDGSDV